MCRVRASMRIALLTLIAMFALTSAASTAVAAEQPSRAVGATTAPVEAPVSIVMIGLSGVNLQTGTFDATFYLSITCPQECDKEGWEMVNATSVSSELVSEEGSTTWWRVNGRFVFQPDLKLFPFDTQRLPIVIEHKRLDADSLVFTPDVANSEVAPDVGVSGWIVEPFTFTASESSYRVLEATFSEVTFTVPIGRSAIASVTKFYLPLLIFIMLAAATLVLSRNDMQLRLGGTVLIGVTLFYLATNEQVTTVGYLTVWDASVLVGFLSIGLVLVAGITGSYLYNEKAFEGPEGEARNKRLRFRYLRVVIAVVAVGAVAITAVALLT